MSKSKYYFGQNIVGQVLKLIPLSIVSKATKETGSDFAVKKFSPQNHLYTMWNYPLIKTLKYYWMKR